MRNQQRYAIVDLETTGGRPERSRITEVAVVLHDGEQILDQWSTLINPECPIPPAIVRLTGITDEMVADAPMFHEVAREIVERTDGAIFVAHNVRFDYNFLRAEYARLGYTFTRRRLCTVRLSRQAFPGLSSYSLQNLIHTFDISVKHRHRALDDALATAEVLYRILHKDMGSAAVQSMVNLGIRESLLPKNIGISDIQALPEEAGVYYFHDTQGRVVYVGKSNNIQKRVAQHFAKITSKASKLQAQVDSITYECTGSELIALLLESYEIKRLQPPINRAQRRRQFPYIVYTWADEYGYRRFQATKVSSKARKDYDILSSHPTIGSARGRLHRAVEDWDLCWQLCGLDIQRTGACFNYHLEKCSGACVQEEDVAAYNERAEQALDYLRKTTQDSYLLIDQGRHQEEQSVVWVQAGRFVGYGFVDQQCCQTEALIDAVTYMPENGECMDIIHRWLGRSARRYRKVPLQD